tara:strand:- start:378 stop:551 length:174 start_codon:yes stop_codon:yes gene_type:complete
LDVIFKQKGARMSKDKEIKKYKEQAEKLKAAYLQCLGVIQYLEAGESKEEDAKKKDK